MKQFAAFQWSGFQGSIELCRFLDAVTDDLIEAVCAVVGTNTVFIKGGVITQAGGNTTITDGIILKDQKLYSFVGGTYPGTPATLKILFEEKTAASFPQPRFVNDNVPKDIYLDRTAKVDASGTIFLNIIGAFQNIQSTNNALTTQLAAINTTLANKVDKGINWVVPNSSLSNINALESSRPKIRAAIDDTGMLLIEFCFSTGGVNIAANSLLCTFDNFLPGYVWDKCVPISCKQNGGGATLGHLSFTANGQKLEIRNLTAIQSPYNWVVQLVTLIP